MCTLLQIRLVFMSQLFEWMLHGHLKNAQYYNIKTFLVYRNQIRYAENICLLISKFPNKIKFIYSERATKFCDISTLLLTGTRTKVRCRFRKILWHSQIIWTLWKKNCYDILFCMEKLHQINYKRNQKKRTNKFDFPRRGFQNHLCSYFGLTDERLNRLTKRHIKNSKK